MDILKHRKRGYSNIGNDGIIKFIFKTLGISTGTFVEFGAYDGVKNSNCKKLQEKGWNGIFIEPDVERFEKLEKEYINCKDKITCINCKIELQGDNLFDNVVGPCLEGENIDFCSIDVDGLDLEIFETFDEHLPTVVCIEGGQALSPYYERVEKSVAQNCIQQSLKVMVDSFEQKGYKILCCYQDCFFIRKELYDSFDVSEDLITLYFNGLRSRPLCMSYVKDYTDAAGIKNEIVDYVLERSNYSEYGFSNRHVWAVEQLNKILKALNEKEEELKE